MPKMNRKKRDDDVWSEKVELGGRSVVDGYGGEMEADNGWE